jgi:hypothetical protein
MKVFLILFLFSIGFSQVITLERTACYGTCPIYKVSVFENGEVIYNGEKYVKTLGIVKYKVDTNIIKILINEFLKVSYFSLKENYFRKILSVKIDENGDEIEEFELVTDLPTTFTSFSYNGKFHKIRNYYGAPALLDSLEIKIEELLNTQKLIN